MGAQEQFEEYRATEYKRLVENHKLARKRKIKGWVIFLVVIILILSLASFFDKTLFLVLFLWLTFGGMLVSFVVIGFNDKLRRNDKQDLRFHIAQAIVFLENYLKNKDLGELNKSKKFLKRISSYREYTTEPGFDFEKTLNELYATLSIFIKKKIIPQFKKIPTKDGTSAYDYTYNQLLKIFLGLEHEEQYTGFIQHFRINADKRDLTPTNTTRFFIHKNKWEILIVLVVIFLLVGIYFKPNNALLLSVLTAFVALVPMFYKKLHNAYKS